METIETLKNRQRFQVKKDIIAYDIEYQIIYFMDMLLDDCDFINEYGRMVGNFERDFKEHKEFNSAEDIDVILEYLVKWYNEKFFITTNRYYDPDRAVKYRQKKGSEHMHYKLCGIIDNLYSLRELYKK